MFPDPVIQQKKLAVLGLAGALGNVLGLLLAGVAMLENYQCVGRAARYAEADVQAVLPSDHLHLWRESHLEPDGGSR